MTALVEDMQGEWMEAQTLGSREECMSILHALALPQDFPYDAIANICSLAELTYYVEMYEDIADEEDMLQDYVQDMETMLASKARAIRMAKHYGRPLRDVIADMDAKDGASLALPTDPCMLRALGEMRNTLESETAYCVDKLSPIVSWNHEHLGHYFHN